MKKLNELSIKESLEGLKELKFTPQDLVFACLDEIKTKDEDLRAFVTLVREEALKSAARADDLIRELGGEAFARFPLLGVPYALKDNFCTENVLTTASSNIIRNFSPPYESTVSKKLKEAGAILLGKTNLDAFAHGSSTEASDFFTTKNPYDITRLPGGSSGGSAAAVASNMCIFAVGSETAGSIRQPAAWCGVVGLKPTYGRVSRYGVISMASSTDSPGPLTKTVWDAAFILNIISGKDEFDATSTDIDVSDFTRSVGRTETKLKIGIAKSYFVKGMDEGVKSKVLEAVGVLKKEGYSVKEVDLLDPKYSVAVYTIIQRSEVSSNLARFDGIRYGFDRSSFGFEAKKRIMLGTYTLSAGYYDQFYAKAQKVRTLSIEIFKRAFSEVDVIVGPISPCTALKEGATKDNAMFGEIQDMLLEPSSMAGITGISVPCGFSNGLPVGFGIMADKFNEEKVLNLAASYEASRGEL